MPWPRAATGAPDWYEEVEVEATGGTQRDEVALGGSESAREVRQLCYLSSLGCRGDVQGAKLSGVVDMTCRRAWTRPLLTRKGRLWGSGVAGDAGDDLT